MQILCIRHLNRLHGIFLIIPLALWSSLGLGCSSSANSTIPIPDDGTTLNAEPAWSPDGQQFAYTHYPQTPEERAYGSNQIWIGSVADKGRFITPGQTPAWSPDGSQIAFVRHGDIWIVAVMSLAESQITNIGSCFNPSWSPDGRRIVYKVEEGGQTSTDSAGIWVTELATQKRVQLLRFLGGQPSWAPSGGMITFSAAIASAAPYEEIAVIDTLGKQLQRLTTNTLRDRSPTWSADGQRILWTQYGRTPSAGPEIWQMALDGSDQKMLLKGGTDVAVSPTDGRMLYVGFDSRTGAGSLWSAGADGQDPSPLTWQ